MSGRTRWLSMAALAVAASGLGLLGGRLLLTPVQGDLLVLASASKPDRIAASTVEIHSSVGWTRLGRFTERSVPAAPGTSTLLESKVAVGLYDALKADNQVLPIRISVQRTVLAPVLIGVTEGRPMKQAIYGGSESVSLGLNELSGQMKPLPSFKLVDQFGRTFDNSAVAGYNVILAAFHTTCHESCPLYTGLFLQLRKQLPPSVRLIEATTDPREDTPDVLRRYAGAVGASWTFLTGDPAALADFWKPFDVELSTGDVHRSTLALIDSHGYIRSYYLGAPDVGGSLPAPVTDLLNAEGQNLLRSHGSGWGQAQVIDSLNAIGGLASPSSNGEEGQAPDFALPSLSREKASLSQYRGRPLLINFWATYCVPCRVEMPLIQRMADQHPKLVVLLVDERDSTPAARSLVDDLHIHSTVLIDNDGKAGDLYRITGLPTTLFVRPDGSIEGRYLGQTSEQILDPHIAAIGA
jgi:cytochrome c biogenesis protein CcmG/thiol:disulfide interchange protein DsbE